MTARSIGTLFTLALSIAAIAHAESDPLKNLAPHPRLVFLDSDIPAIKATIASDPFAAANFAELQHNSNDFLGKAVRPFKAKEGGDELTTARETEEVILTLAGAYRLTGNKKYADRAIAEMLSVAAFPSWDAVHLDSAEFTAALGLGYDWLYPILTQPQRDAIHAAIVHKGLDPWINNIGPKSASNPKPFDKNNNWVQVCVGGDTIGALALADVEPARARIVIADSVVKMKKIMQLFAPDGGFEEGPNYWGYATIYNVLYLSSLQTALGTEYGLTQMPGFADTGNYFIQTISPLYLPANFGDAHAGLYRAPQMFWMATKYNKPEYAVAERRLDQAYDTLPEDRREPGESIRFQIFSLVWYRTPSATAALPTVASFQRVDQAFLRSDWSLPNGKEDPNAFAIAFKGGSAQASHGHLDIGSFLLDALGERWAIDLGSDSYHLPDYFNSHGPRWTYFRTRNDAHNTLTIDGALQDLDTYAHITAVGQAASGFPKYAVLDLDSANKEKLKHWSRGIQMLSASRVIVQDEVTPTASADVVWRIMTPASAKVEQNPTDVTLTLHNKKLHLHIVTPTGAQFVTRTVPSPGSGQFPITGITEVSIHLNKLAKPETLSVLFSTDDDKSPSPAITALDTWSTQAGVNK